VQRSVDALKQDDLETFGRLINESHESLKEDYEVSSAELDLMVDLARSQYGLVLGARMTGGGFGGCTVNLLKAGDHSEFRRLVSEGYGRATGKRPDIYEFEISDGVGEIT
jgi:galactokinase